MFSFQLIKLNASLCAVAEGGGAGRAGEGREQSLHYKLSVQNTYLVVFNAHSGRCREHSLPPRVTLKPPAPSPWGDGWNLVPKRR